KRAHCNICISHIDRKQHKRPPLIFLPSRFCIFSPYLYIIAVKKDRSQRFLQSFYYCPPRPLSKAAGRNLCPLPIQPRSISYYPLMLPLCLTRRCSPRVSEPLDLSRRRLLKLCVADDQAVDLLLRRCSAVVLVDDLLQLLPHILDPFLLHVVLIRVDLCLDDAFVLADKNLAHKTVRAQRIFQLLRRNVFTVLRDDQILLAPC